MAKVFSSCFFLDFYDKDAVFARIIVRGRHSVAIVYAGGDVHRVLSNFISKQAKRLERGV